MAGEKKLYLIERTGHPCCGMKKGQLYPGKVDSVFNPIYFEPCVDGEWRGPHYKGFKIRYEIPQDEYQQNKGSGNE